MNQQDKSFMITFTVIMSVLVMIAIAIFLASRLISLVTVNTADDGGRRQATIEERIQPIGRVAVADPSKKQEQVATAEQSPEELYNTVCSACHAAGVLQAPKIGSKEEWEPRAVQGLDTLVNHAVNGFKAMPAKGGNPNLTEDDIRKTIVYMLEKSNIQVTVAEDAEAATPAAPAPAEQATAPAEEGTKQDAGSGDYDLAQGQEVYGSACALCHEQGVANAPKHADKTAWEPRAQQGMATLFDHAIKGFKAMPARGGNPNLTDDQIRNAIAFMLSEAGIEPGSAQ